MKINTDEKKIDEILTRGVHEIITHKELKEKLLSGKQLHLKLGTDVTGPDLHLGHAVVQKKLRDFQELGHKVTLIIGDMTTLVGDHSDKVDMRTETNAAEISKNEKAYTQQFFKTVVKEQTTIRHNSEWLSKLDFNDLIFLGKQFTIAQMLDRDTFMQRYKQEKPIGLDEFFYPLMQGYDSVALECDVEFGGTDQTFNLLAGRKLMPAFDLKPQSAVVMKLLVGSDGRPMGKSLQNFIPILDNPIDMFGKVMSIVDDVIFDYFELVTRVDMDEIEKMKLAVEDGANPMEFKKTLALDIVTFYHSKEDALKAQKVFEETVQGREVSEELINEIDVKGKMSLLEFLKDALPAGLASSGEIKRVVTQGGVEVDGKKVADFAREINFESGIVVKFGKRTFVKVK